MLKRKKKKKKRKTRKGVLVDLEKKGESLDSNFIQKGRERGKSLCRESGRRKGETLLSLYRRRRAEPVLLMATKIAFTVNGGVKGKKRQHKPTEPGEKGTNASLIGAAAEGGRDSVRTLPPT